MVWTPMLNSLQCNFKGEFSQNAFVKGKFSVKQNDTIKTNAEGQFDTPLKMINQPAWASDVSLKD